MSDPTYRVEIFEYATGKTEAVIGNVLTKDKAEKRQMTGLSRCNSNYGCRIINEQTGEVE